MLIPYSSNPPPLTHPYVSNCSYGSALNSLSFHYCYSVHCCYCYCCCYSGLPIHLPCRTWLTASGPISERYHRRKLTLIRRDKPDSRTRNSRSECVRIVSLTAPLGGYAKCKPETINYYNYLTFRARSPLSSQQNNIFSSTHLIILTATGHETLVHSAKCRINGKVALRHALEATHQTPILKVPQVQTLRRDIE